MKSYKKIVLGLVLAVASLLFGSLFLNHDNHASAASANFTAAQIQGASGFNFGNGGSTITGKINGQTVTFTGGPPVLQESYQTLESQKNSCPAAGANGCGPFVYKPSPSDEFCEANPWNNTNPNYPGPWGNLPSEGVTYPNELLVFPSDLNLTGSNSATSNAVGSATAYLVAFGSTSTGGCDAAPAGSSTTGVKLNVGVTSGTPTGAVIDQQSIDTATYAFKGDGSTIEGSYTLADGSKATVDFVDQEPYDRNRNFAPSNGLPTGFCSSAGTGSGLTFDNSAQGDPTITFTSVQLPVVTNASGNCALSQNPSPASTVPNPNDIAEEVFEWAGSNGDSLVSLGNGDQTLTPDSGATGSDANRIYDQNGNACSGWAVLLDSTGGSTGTLYHLSSGKGTIANGYFTDCTADSGTPKAVIVNGSQGSGPDCTNDPTNPACAAGGTGPSSCDNHTQGWPLGWIACPVLEAADSLATNLMQLFESQLPFTVCESGVNSCSTTTGLNCTTAAGNSNQDCGQSLGSSTDKVHNAWSIMRILASAMIVIVMLVMVISQAVGGGPFEAYTVRKMLPRLVAAVILIQISWPLFAYIVDLVNDVGNGLGDLLAAPFGGSQNFTFGHLLGNAKIGELQGFFVNYLVLIPAAAITLWLALPTVLAFCFIGLLTLFMGLAVLVFRKTLIILLLIFSPIALLVWIFPGPSMQKYWKLWQENFTKTLFMYPLIVGIIMAGRIFAYVVGAQNNGTLLNLIFIMIGWFAPLAIIVKSYKWGGSAMVAASGYASKANEKLAARPKKYFQSKQESLNAERRLQSQKRYDNPDLYGKNRRSKVASLWNRPIDRFRSGQWDPLMYGQRREKAMARYRQEGEKSDLEDVQAKEVSQKGDWQQLNEEGALPDEAQYRDAQGRKLSRGTKDDMLQSIMWQKDITDKNGNAKVYLTHDGRRINPLDKYHTELDQRAALLGMAKLRGGTNLRHIAAIYKQAKEGTGPISYADMRRFFNQNLDPMLDILTLEYKGFDSTADAGPAGISRHHGVNVENMLSRGYIRIKGREGDLKKATDSGNQTAIDAAQDSLKRAVTSYNRYINSAVEGMQNPNMSGNFEQGNTRAFLGALSTDPAKAQRIIAGINNPEDEDGRLNPRVNLEPMVHDEAFLRKYVDTQSPGLRATVDALIDERGGVKKIQGRSAVEGGGGEAETQTREAREGETVNLHPQGEAPAADVSQSTGTPYTQTGQAPGAAAPQAAAPVAAPQPGQTVRPTVEAAPVAGRAETGPVQATIDPATLQALIATQGASMRPQSVVQLLNEFRDSIPQEVRRSVRQELRGRGVNLPHDDDDDESPTPPPAA